MTDEKFESWWDSEGQFGRAGGSDYEKTFAYNAWEARGRSEEEKTFDPTDPLQPTKFIYKDTE